jgi:hypothetical protein
MIVASWSNVHGQAGNTSNMIAVASAVAMRYNRRCMLTQTHFILNNLDTFLTGKRYGSQTMDNGLDGLSRILKLHPLDKDTIENYSIPILYKKLTLLPGTSSENRKIFTADMEKTFGILLDELDRFYDMVFVDVNSGFDELSKLILDKSDIVMVNLCQNINVIDHYAKECQIRDKRILYLLGNYDKDSSFNLYNLRILYKFLSKDNTGVVPYNTEFMDAQSEGNVIRFFRKNSDNVGSNRYFMECVHDAAAKLVKMSGYKGSEEAKWQIISSL